MNRYVSWKWIKKAIFNFNSLKIFLVTVAIALLSFFIKDPILNLLVNKGVSVPSAMIVELVGVVAIDAIIYLVALGLLKEDLVSSFLRKRDKANA